MSYLSDTFGVPLTKQFKQQELPDLQVTPESLMAPEQPFGAQPFGNLNALGVSTPNTPPYGAAGQSQQSVPPLAPMTPGSQFTPSVQYDPAISPVTAGAGMQSPALPQALTESYNTPGAYPAPAQLLDMPTRDQKAESKRLATMAGAGGILGLLLGGGAGALQGAMGAVEGGRSALDFAAQNEAQKVQMENQRRLSESANERQSWVDRMTVEDRDIQRQIAKDQTELRRIAEENDRKTANERDRTSRLNHLLSERTKNLEVVNKYFDAEGNPLLNASGEPISLIAVQRWNDRVDSMGFPELRIDESEITYTPSAAVAGVGAKTRATEASIEKILQDVDFNEAVKSVRILAEQGKLKGQELSNRLKEIDIQYAPRTKEAKIAYDNAMRNLLPERINLIRSQTSKNQAQTANTLAKAQEVKPVLLTDLEKKEQESIRRDLTPQGWNKIVSDLTKSAGLIDFIQLDPNSAMGKQQAQKRAKLEEDIAQAKKSLQSRAEKAGFTELGEIGTGVFTLPKPRTVKIPSSINYLADNAPNGFGSYNDKWTGQDIAEFRKLAEGKSTIIKEVPSSMVSNLNPLGWRTSIYGYKGDNVKGDVGSPKGIGTQDKPLMPGAIAVSADVRESLKQRGYDMGSRVPIFFQKGGKTFKGSFVIRDVTAKQVDGKPLKGRVDLFMPAGNDETMRLYDDASIIGIGRKDVPPIKVEEVKAPAKKPGAPKPTAKVQSSKPLSQMSQAELLALRKSMSPTNVFGNMQ